MPFIGLTNEERRDLESEVVSNDARTRLTRLMRAQCAARDGNVELINYNRYINIARSLMGLSVYRLEPDDWGMYQNEEFGWHFGEAELVMRRPDTATFVEMLGDFIQQRMLPLCEVNDILAADNTTVRFRIHGFGDDVSVEILELAALEDEGLEKEHPNVRLLVERMEDAFARKDYSAVLHACGSVFETLAKNVFDDPKVETEPLGAFFDGYRKRSALPSPLLDFIRDTYARRNHEPLAAHGATREPTVTAKDAAVLIEMTKTCVRLERRLAEPEQKRKGLDQKAGTARASGRGDQVSPPHRKGRSGSDRN